MSDEEKLKRSQKTFENGIESVKKGVRDLKKFVIWLLSYLETPIIAVVGIVDSIVMIIIRIFSNYEELENDCNLSAEILEEIGKNKINDKGILKKQIHSILSIPLTVIIMYNWLYLTCFKERIIINTTAEDWIKSLFSGVSAGAGVITGTIRSGINIASETASKAKEIASKTAASASEIASKAKTMATETIDSVKQKASDVKDSIKETIKTKFNAKPKEEEDADEVVKDDEDEDNELAGEDNKPGSENEIKGGDVGEENKEDEKKDDKAGEEDENKDDEDKIEDDDEDKIEDENKEDEDKIEDENKDDEDEIVEDESPLAESKWKKAKDGFNKMMEGDPLSNWKVYAPLLHMIAPVSIFDKWIFGFFNIINTYVISPNLHPLLYYLLFFKIFFDFVRKNQGTIGKTLSDAIDYLFADSNGAASISIPGSISQWSSLFVTWSFLCSIPEGVANISREFWIVSVVKTFLFIISYVLIMVYIDQVCIYVILYFIFYSFGAIIFFNRKTSGLFEMMYKMDIYFYKRIVGFQNKNDHILNTTINTVFLFIFEIIVLLFLIKGLTDYIANIEAVELKITMALLNLMMIYLLMKYCSYKFITIWPKYKQDVQDDNYNNIRKDFGDIIPIESYADAVNSYKTKTSDVVENQMLNIDWDNSSKPMSNAAKLAYNMALNNPLTKAIAAPLVNTFSAATQNYNTAKTETKRKLKEFKQGVSDTKKTLEDSIDNFKDTAKNFKMSNMVVPESMRSTRKNESDEIVDDDDDVVEEESGTNNETKG
jgi:hypothetical protein